MSCRLFSVEKSYHLSWIFRSPISVQMFNYWYRLVLVFRIDTPYVGFGAGKWKTKNTCIRIYPGNTVFAEVFVKLLCWIWSWLETPASQPLIASWCHGFISGQTGGISYYQTQKCQAVRAISRAAGLIQHCFSSFCHMWDELSLCLDPLAVRL